MNISSKRVRCLSLLRFIALVLAVAALSLATVPASAQSSKVFNWKLQTVDQPPQIGPKEILPAWVDRIKKMSGGRLNIQVFTAAQILPTGEILNGLTKGIIEMAYTSPVYYTGAIPESFLTSPAIPPMVVQGFDAAQELWWYGGLDDIIREAYLERGVYFLGTVFTGEPVAHWSRKPMLRLADMKGYKVRGFGYVAKTIQKLGGAPVFMPQAEVYTALSQGVIDGSMTAATSYETAKFFEHAKYFYIDPLLSSSSMSLMVSKQHWDQLPNDLQTILQVANRWYSQQFQIRNRQEYRKMVAKFDKMGVTTIAWPKEDLDRFRAAAAEFLPGIASKGPRVAKGIKIIQDYLASQ